MTTVGSLCSGYTGLDMGLALALGVPLRHAWHVENDPAPSKILAARYPGVPNYGDLKLLPYADMEPVDWLTAGYPCQPFSNAGLRLGEADERHLWPYVADTIGALRPRGVLLENVAAHARRGLDSVAADLACMGYDAIWGVVPASKAGAPHLRQRVFVLATDASDRPDKLERTRPESRGRGSEVAADAADEQHERAGSSRYGRPGPAHSGASDADAASHGRNQGRAEPAGQLWRPDAAERGTAPVADAYGEGLEVGPGVGDDARQERQATERGSRAGLDWGVYATAIRRWELVTGRPAPWATEPRGRGGAERLSPAFVEWMMGLPAGWVTAVPGLSVNAQLKALGNGVVPQQAALAVRLLTSTVAAEVAA